MLQVRFGARSDQPAGRSTRLPDADDRRHGASAGQREGSQPGAKGLARRRL